MLVFGCEAKTKVWLVLDGDTLYVDRDSDGDLTEEKERIKGKASSSRVGGEQRRELEFDVGMIQEPSAKDAHRVTLKDVYRVNNRRQSVNGRLLVNGPLEPTQFVGFEFGTEPKTAPILHFGGPLTMALADGSEQRLLRGKPSTELAIVVGTPGIGEPSFVSLCNDNALVDLHPVADLEFPNKNPNGPPIRARLVVSKRC